MSLQSEMSLFSRLSGRGGALSELKSQMRATEWEQFLYSWSVHGRPKQQYPSLPSRDWDGALFLAGRGFGKTRTGAEWMHRWAEGGEVSMALIGQTLQSVRDVMIFGESGLLKTAKPWNPCEYITTKRKVVWQNGSYALLYNGEEPARLRGPQFHYAWCDEIASWRYAEESWVMLRMGLRLPHPKLDSTKFIITTTPKPLELLRVMVEDPRVVKVYGSTYENAMNLEGSYIDTLKRRYEGTRYAEEEIWGRLNWSTPGALMTPEILNKCRVLFSDEGEELRGVPGVSLLVLPTKVQSQVVRLVVGVDPQTGDGMTGIVVVAEYHMGGRPVCVVLEDASVNGRPDEWSVAVNNVLMRWQEKFRLGLGSCVVVVEKNQGGQMVEQTLRNVNSMMPIETVWSKESKAARAEPVMSAHGHGSVYYEGRFPELEREMCGWVPGESNWSPNRLDALVFACTKILFEKRGKGYSVWQLW